MSSTVRIKVGAPFDPAHGKQRFIATLADTPAATAFKKLLPLSLMMEELNANEKFATLPSKLPTRPARPASIQSGDVMLYGSDTLVMFYKSFRTTYTYTPIGRIDDPAGLEKALGPKASR